MADSARTVVRQLFLLAGIGGLLLPVVVNANMDCDAEGRYCTVTEHFRDQQEALDACVDFSLSLGYTTACSAGGWGPVYAVSKGWLSAGGPGSNDYPFYNLKFYFGLERRNEDPCTNQTGNPMDFTSGIKYQREVDYQSAGPHPLVVERVYSSRVVGYDGTAVNKNWRFNFEKEIDAEQSLNDSRVVIIRPDQSVLFYTKETGGAWVTDPDITLKLTEVTASGERVGWQLHDRNDMIEHYNAAGQLQSIVYRDGYTQSYSYQDTTLTISDSFNRTLVIQFDANGVVQSFTDPAGRLYTYQYASYGNLQSIIFPDDTPANQEDNPRRLYHYEYSTYRQFLTGITDERGVRYVTWQYLQHRVRVSKNPNDVNKTSVTYDNATTSTVTNPLGKKTTYHFEKIHGVPKITSVDGILSSHCGASNKSYSYDANGYPDQVTDWNGNITDYDYNTRGLVDSQTDALGTADTRTTTTQWHATLRLPTQISEAGKTTTYVYDDANGTGNILSKTETDTSVTPNVSRTWTYTYNTDSQVLTIDGPRSDVTDITTYTYDAQGNRSSVTNALNQTTLYTSYDAHGKLLSMTDPNGVVTTLSYDARQRLLTRTVAAGTADTATTEFEYDAVGNLTRITQADGSYLDYTYDDADRLVEIEDNLGNRIEYTLDNAGNRTAQQTYNAADVLVQTQTAVFDELSRLIETIGASSQRTEYEYDDNGNPIQITDPKDAATIQAFDALNRLIEIQDPLNGATDPTEYGYDDQDNLTQVTDPEGNVTTYTYNGFGEVITQTSPNTGTTTYTYDAAGNRSTQTDARNITTTYSYDALNRLTGIAYPDNTENVTYTYDQTINGNIGIGRLTQINDHSGSTQYHYDRRGNITTVTTTINVASQPRIFTTHYAYDLADNLIQITYPDGRTIDYQRNEIGQITEVRTSFEGQTQILASSIDYQAFGPLQGLTYGNGLTENRGYDLDGRLELLNNGVQNFDYNYDPNSNIETIIDLIDANQNQTYIYDLLDRLTDADSSADNLDYSYDVVGNRLSYTNSTGTDTYSYEVGSQILSSISGTTQLAYTTDAVGNTIQVDTNTYSYNDANRLEQATVTGQQLSFIYNALGQRVIKTSPERSTVYLYDLNGQLIAETDANGTLEKTYVYLNGAPLAMIISGEDSSEPPPPIDFNSVTLGLFAGIYGTNALDEFLDDGLTYHMRGFNLKKIYLPYTITANTVLEFDFHSPQEGDYHMLGFAVDDEFLDEQTFKLYGEMPCASEDLGYIGNDQVQSYRVELGQHLTIGTTYNYLVFINGDESSTPIAESYFSNVRLYEADQYAAVVTDPEIVYYHNDHLNTPKVMTDQLQQIVWQANYAPFGEAQITVDTVTNNLRFPGQYFDQETGLHYNYFRYYDPSTGRYVTSDPIGLEGGLNTYAYVGGNPIRATDFWGLSSSYAECKKSADKWVEKCYWLYDLNDYGCNVSRKAVERLCPPCAWAEKLEERCDRAHKGALENCRIIYEQKVEKCKEDSCD